MSGREWSGTFNGGELIVRRRRGIALWASAELTSARSDASTRPIETYSLLFLVEKESLCGEGLPNNQLVKNCCVGTLLVPNGEYSACNLLPYLYLKAPNIQRTFN